MLCGGDELGRTQLGNNNAYCQDNEISWFHWDLTPVQNDLLEFTRYLVRLRKTQPVLMRRRFFQGRSIRGAGVKDIAWFEPSGREMTDADWNAHSAHCLGVFLNGKELQEIDEEGGPIEGDTLFVMFNAQHETISFALPMPGPDDVWERILDTAEKRWKRRQRLRDHSYKLRSRSLAVFRLAGKRKVFW